MSRSDIPFRTDILRARYIPMTNMLEMVSLAQIGRKYSAKGDLIDA